MMRQPRKGRINTVVNLIDSSNRMQIHLFTSLYHPLHQNWMWIFLQLLQSAWNNVHLSSGNALTSQHPAVEMARLAKSSWGPVPVSLLENLLDCRPQCPWASAYPGIFWRYLCWPFVAPIDFGKICDETTTANDTSQLFFAEQVDLKKHHLLCSQEVQVDQTLPIGRIGNPSHGNHPKGLCWSTGLPGS